LPRRQNAKKLTRQINDEVQIDWN